MKKRALWITLVLMQAILLLGCPPPPPPPEPLAGDKLILEQLIARRHKMSPMEADVKFMFPPGEFLTATLEGHAAYRLDSDKARLRVAVVGPLGAISMDLLVEQGDFWVKLPGYTEALCQKDLCIIYGDSALIRTPSILARLPGLFFGGIPDDLGEDWTFEEDAEGKWILPPGKKDEKYLVRGNPAVIVKAILSEEGIGTLNVDLDQVEDSLAGPLPTRIIVRFEGRALFSLKLRDCTFGAPLPDGVFKMGGGNGPGAR